MSDAKDKHWKGQSRVLKVCHWCTKKQEPGVKPFQACARCKEVIYCSKECQVASWPLHKAPCKLSSQAKTLAAENPGMAQAVANFKKWHSSHIEELRHAVICALNLGNKPSALNDNVIFIQVQLKSDHAALPAHKKYEVAGGFIMTMKETIDLIGGHGGQDILESGKAANIHMQKRGSLGVATVLMKAHDMIDVVKIVLPSPQAARTAQAANDWGEAWVDRLQLAVD